MKAKVTCYFWQVMNLHYITFIFYSLSSSLICSQSPIYPGYFGPLVSLNQNNQQNNPAAFLDSDSTFLQLHGAFHAQLPGLQNIALDVKFRHQNYFFDQHINFQGISTLQNLKYISQLGMLLDPDLKIGIGLGLQSIIQDAYYGNHWSAMTKFGLQYQYQNKQFYSFSFELNTRQQHAVVTFAFANRLGLELFYFANLLWVQSLPPQLCFGFEQIIQDYRIRIFAALQPQLYGFVLERQCKQPSMWSLGLQWQDKIGLGFFWNLKLIKK